MLSISYENLGTMNRSDLDRIKRQRVSALERYKKNYREMAQLKRRLAEVGPRVHKYRQVVEECDEILEANGLKKLTR